MLQHRWTFNSYAKWTVRHTPTQKQILYNFIKIIETDSGLVAVREREEENTESVCRGCGVLVLWDENI